MNKLIALIFTVGLAASAPVLAEIQSPSSTTTNPAGTGSMPPSTMPTTPDSMTTPGSTAPSGDTTGNTTMEMAKERYKAAKAECMTRTGNAREVCMKEANAAYKADRTSGVTTNPQPGSVGSPMQ